MNSTDLNGTFTDDDSVGDDDIIENSDYSDHISNTLQTIEGDSITSKKSVSIQDDESSNASLGSSEEIEDNSIISPQKSTRKNIKRIIDSDSEDDESEEPQQVKTVGKITDSDYEDDDSEEPERVKNVGKITDSDYEDDDSEEPDRVKTVGKIADSDYEDEEEEEIAAITKNKPPQIFRPSLHASTPRVSRAVIPSRSPSPANSIIELSDEDETETEIPQIPKQVTLDQFVHKFERPVLSLVNHVVKLEGAEKKLVDYLTYQAQVEKVKRYEMKVNQTEHALKSINLANLPDKGALIIKVNKDAQADLIREKQILDNMQSSGAIAPALKPETANWEDVKAGLGDVMPRTFGKRGMANFHAEKAVTVERLEQLHGSLKTRPLETDLATDPKGLTVELMEHQKHALSWMTWREGQKPSGGILADDMGLGKTLTVISLMLKAKELGEDEENQPSRSNSSKYPGGTLIVCPASLINQWSGEVSKRTKRGLISVEVHHGGNRETRPRRLAQHDMVITTYGLAVSECAKSGALYGVKWNRIVLDEAHQTRNHKTATSEAVCKLAGKFRWALTGTPVHNKEMDLYALFKFLRCSPFDDMTVWKHWVGDKTSGGQERLHTVISSIMLRRTKEEMMKKSEIFSLPERRTQLIPMKLDKEEQDVYERILIFSRTLFAQFLHQRATKNQDAFDVQMQINNNPNSEYFKIRDKLLKLNKVKEVSQHEILTLLLRLRQTCCHPSLITKMLNGDEDLGDEESSEHSEELNLLEQLNKLNLDDGKDDDVVNGPVVAPESATLQEASKGFLNPTNPVFRKERLSSKFKILMDLLKEKLSGDDKAIIVSQWTSLLDLLAYQFTQEGITFGRLDGNVPIKNRMPIVDDINNPRSKTQVLLLSLTAGGVGLNLVGANHLILLDLHWNPQLELQAQDRIYRMGQKKPVYVHKIMVTDTIEQRVQELQEMKLAIADAILTGSKRAVSSKLNLQDLKVLFGF